MKWLKYNVIKLRNDSKRNEVTNIGIIILEDDLIVDVRMTNNLTKVNTLLESETTNEVFECMKKDILEFGNKFFDLHMYGTEIYLGGTGSFKVDNDTEEKINKLYNDYFNDNQERFVYTIDCEWDIGQENSVFDCNIKAYKFAEEMLNREDVLDSIGYESIDDVVNDGMLIINKIKVM